MFDVYRCELLAPGVSLHDASPAAAPDALLGSRDSAPLSAAAPETDEDYVRLIYTVAYGLDGASPYRFERNPAPPEARVPADPQPARGGETAPADDRLERHGIYGFPRGFLARRARRGRA